MGYLKNLRHKQEAEQAKLQPGITMIGTLEETLEAFIKEQLLEAGHKTMVPFTMHGMKSSIFGNKVTSFTADIKSTPTETRPSRSATIQYP